MTKLKDLTTGQIQRIIAVKEQIEVLKGQIDSIAAGGGDGTGISTPFSEAKPPKKRRMSRAGRAAIAAAARARWAKYRGNRSAKAEKPAKKRREVSAAVKAKLASIARARWAKAKKAGKTTL
jgi:hypothetical protein